MQRAGVTPWERTRGLEACIYKTKNGVMKNIHSAIMCAVLLFLITLTGIHVSKGSLECSNTVIM